MLFNMWCEDNQQSKPVTIRKVLRIAGLVVLGIGFAALFALLFGYFVMLLWNWLMPEIFHLSKINFWQAFGLVLLARLFFGSPEGKGHHRHDHKGKHDSKDFPVERKEWDNFHSWWEDYGKEAFKRYVEGKKMETLDAEGTVKTD